MGVELVEEELEVEDTDALLEAETEDWDKLSMLLGNAPYFRTRPN